MAIYKVWRIGKSGQAIQIEAPDEKSAAEKFAVRTIPPDSVLIIEPFSVWVQAPDPEATLTRWIVNVFYVVRAVAMSASDLIYYED